MIEMRLAKEEDVQFAADCFDCAREYQKEQGFLQWTDEYPNITTAIEDVKSKKGFIYYEKSALIGYVCIDFDGELTYNEIQGEWKTNQKYAVVHRLALSKSARGKGFSKEIFRLIKEFCIENNVFSIRVDTDKNNEIMQNILRKESFEYCGVIYFQGGPKLAYECEILL